VISTADGTGARALEWTYSFIVGAAFRYLT